MTSDVAATPTGDRTDTRDRPMTDRMLIKDAIVLTQDPRSASCRRGHPRRGRHDRRGRPGPRRGRRRSSTPTGDIVIPGFIDTHRHTWETSIRTCAPDYTLIAYFGAILDKFAPKYRPDDVYAANQWGALECINAGITTLVDWSHIMNTPTHADAAIQGLQERASAPCSPSGSRTRRSSTGGSARTTRAASERIDGDLGAADPGAVLQRRPGRWSRWRSPPAAPNFCKPDVVRYEWELAKELGINITVHVAMDRFGYTKGQLTALRDMDLLYPNTTYIHASHLTDEEWAARPRLGRQRVARARRSRSRWATAGRRP